MTFPLVTVICLSYNHERFIEEAVQSVLNQSYGNIELILVDDASVDRSQEKIKEMAFRYDRIQTLLLKKNVGNCKAFNKALALAKGEYIIDLAADDVLLPERIEKQIRHFEKLGTDYGVVFTDAVYIDEGGNKLRNHYEYLFSKGLLKSVPEGDVFSEVIKRYFIASPTMMVRRQIINELNGYDERLSYEDFDFWVRASRITRFGFLNELLTAIRKHKTSMSTGWYKPGDTQLFSTYMVCLKIRELIRNEDEKNSLKIRAQYELRQSVFSGNKMEAFLFFELLRALKKINILDRFFLMMSQLNLPVTWIRRTYHWLRYS